MVMVTASGSSTIDGIVVYIVERFGLDTHGVHQHTVSRGALIPFTTTVIPLR